LRTIALSTCPDHGPLFNRPGDVNQGLICCGGVPEIKKRPETGITAARGAGYLKHLMTYDERQTARERPARQIRPSSNLQHISKQACFS
jgi:hypothetical protein